MSSCPKRAARHRDPQGKATDELFAMAPCGYLSMRPDGTIVGANERLARLTGRSVDELVVDTRVHDFLSVGSRIYFETHVNPLLHMQGFVDQIALDVQGPQGSVPTLVNAVVRVDDAGSPGLVDIIIVDATERRRYEREILSARNEAEEAARVKSELVAMVSHDIRSPLAAIATVGELLSRSKLSEEQAKFVSILRSSTSTLLGLIDDVLDHGRLEAGRMHLERKPFDLRKLIEVLAEEVRILAERKALALKTTIDGELPSVLVGDRIKLGRVLNNLLSNAIKFTEQGAVNLQLRVVRAGPKAVTVEFEVRDTGIGIPADHVERVFEDFHQGGENIGRQYGGSGLGLGICKRLLDLHGSALQVRSEVGRGTCFNFELSFERA